MSNKRDIPFTPSDLREIADTVEKVLEVVEAGLEDLIPDGDWRWGLRVDIFDDADQIVGEVAPNGDGWIGFYPNGVTR